MVTTTMSITNRSVRSSRLRPRGAPELAEAEEAVLEVDADDVDVDVDVDVELDVAVDVDDAVDVAVDVLLAFEMLDVDVEGEAVEVELDARNTWKHVCNMTI